MTLASSHDTSLQKGGIFRHGFRVSDNFSPRYFFPFFFFLFHRARKVSTILLLFSCHSVYIRLSNVENCRAVFLPQTGAKLASRKFLRITSNDECVNRRRKQEDESMRNN